MPPTGVCISSCSASLPHHQQTSSVLGLLLGRPPSKVRAAAAELQKAAGLAEPAPEQPEYTAAGSQAEQQRDAAVAALQALLAAVGAGNVQGAVTKHQEMKQRLERLDQVGMGFRL